MFTVTHASVLTGKASGKHMARGRINKSSVDAILPGGAEVMLWDDKIAGFGLKVTPAGAKTYLFQYRLGGRAGRTRRFTIGRHGSLTPDRARREAERLAIIVAQGTDPQQEKQDKGRRAIDLAFKGYAQRFVEDCLKIRWKASHKDGEALLRLYAIPVLGNKSLPDIDRADIRAVLQPVRRKVATCRNLFAVLRRLFRWAVSEGDLKVSPLVGMEPPPLPVKRDRVLSDDEVRLFWRATEKQAYPFGPLFRLLLITGQRLEEVSGLQWSELEQAKATWSLPANRAKNGNASRVPLSKLALTELDALAKRTGRKDGWPRRGLVFTTTGETSVSGHSRAKARLDKNISDLAAKEPDMHVGPWRLHDLRRTLATVMQRLGVRFEVTEAILNHVSGSKSGVAGVYQLHDWGTEKVTALQAWADHIAGLLSASDKSNVVSLASVRL
jgi:integrase